MPSETRIATISTVCRGAKTPLQLLHALHLVRYVLNEAQSVEIFQISITRLLTEWRPLARLFTAVLKWVARAYERDSPWTELPAVERLALVWTHADRLTECLASADFDIDQVARDFSANRITRPTSEILRFDNGYHQASANPDTVGANSLLFHGIGYICDRDRADTLLSAAQVDALVDLLSTEVNGGKMPSPWIFLNREGGNNELGSFFTLRPDGLAPIDASAAVVSRQIDDLLKDLESDPLSLTTWPAIWALGQPGLAPADRTRLRVVIEKINFVDIVSRNRNDIVLCRMIVDCWSRLGDEAGYPRLVEKLERLAEFLASQHPVSMRPPVDDAQERDQTQLIEAAALSSRNTDRIEAMRRLGQTFVRLAQAWPAAAERLRHAVDYAAFRESTTYTNVLWRALLELRIG